MTIPKEYGGHGASALDRYVVTEELLAAGAPVAAHWIADRQIGPDAACGSAPRSSGGGYLPGIAAGEVYFGIGMSEPDAGSDLAAVRTRADRVDGGWELTGTKVWTSGAHRAHAFFALARTAPRDERNRHAGLSPVHRRARLAGRADPPDPAADRRPPLQRGGVRPRLRARRAWCSARSAPAGSRSPASWRSSAAARSGSCRRSRCWPPWSGSWPGTTGAEREVGGLVARLWTLRRMSLAVAGSLESGEAPELAAAVVKDLGTRYENEIIDAARLLVADPAGPGRGGRLRPAAGRRRAARARVHPARRDERGAARHRRARAGAALMTSVNAELHELAESIFADAVAAGSGDRASTPDCGRRSRSTGLARLTLPEPRRAAARAPSPTPPWCSPRPGRTRHGCRWWRPTCSPGGCCTPRASPLPDGPLTAVAGDAGRSTARPSAASCAGCRGPGPPPGWRC